MRLIRLRSRTAMTDERSTDFGFQRVPREDKARRVRAVFDSVADHYDLMNDLMSAGMHRLWKRFTLALANLRPGARALDVAAGSGDLAAGLARQVGERGLVVLTDINAAMLRRGRDRLIDAGCVGNVAYVQADAERLPFPDGSFDCITIGFGLRNVTDKSAALTVTRRASRLSGSLPRSLAALQRFAQLEGRSIALEIRAITRLRVAPTAHTLSVTRDDAPADATLTGGLLSLLALAGESADAVLPGEVAIGGDAQLAQKFRELARLLRPDLEEELSLLLGDVPAHQLDRKSVG